MIFLTSCNSFSFSCCCSSERGSAVSIFSCSSFCQPAGSSASKFRGTFRRDKEEEKREKHTGLTRFTQLYVTSKSTYVTRMSSMYYASLPWQTLQGNYLVSPAICLCRTGNLGQWAALEDEGPDKEWRRWC